MISDYIKHYIKIKYSQPILVYHTISITPMKTFKPGRVLTNMLIKITTISSISLSGNNCIVTIDQTGQSFSPSSLLQATGQLSNL